jgi:hypothetical protein
VAIGHGKTRAVGQAQPPAPAFALGCGDGTGHLRAHKIDMAYSWLGLFMAGVSQYLVNPRFGLAEFTSGWTYWSLFAAINIVIYATGSWWIFRRLVGPPDDKEAR